MGDMGELFNAQREATRQHRAEMLAKADTTGWTRHTQWHFSRTFAGERVDWWPSGGKARYKGKMVYGHRRVAELIERLSPAPAPRERITDPDETKVHCRDCNGYLWSIGPAEVATQAEARPGMDPSLISCPMVKEPGGGCTGRLKR